VAQLVQRGNRWLEIVGRLQPGVELAAVQAASKGIAERLMQTYPESNARRSMTVAPINRAMVGFVLRDRTVQYATMIGGVVAIVLLVTCCNVASMMVARSKEKQKDTAIRIALGAGTWRLVARSFAESLMLSAAGGALGLAVALWIARATAGFDVFASFTNIPVVLNGQILAFAFALSIATGLIFGAAPALAATRRPTMAGLRAGTPFLLNVLVVVQVCLSLALIIPGGLFLANVTATYRVDRGFTLQRGVLLSVDLSRAQPVFYTLLRERFPDAATAEIVPLSGSGNRTNVIIEGDRTAVDYNVVDEGYFRVMGIPLIGGRTFNAQDSTPVAVVNESLSRRYGGNLLGRQLMIGQTQYEIVGVARDGKYRSIHEDGLASFYLSFTQNNRRNVTFIIPSTDERTVMNSLHGVIASLDPSFRAYSFGPWTRILHESTRRSVRMPCWSARLPFSLS
jgi:predicted permease